MKGKREEKKKKTENMCFYPNGFYMLAPDSYLTAIITPRATINKASIFITSGTAGRKVNKPLIKNITTPWPVGECFLNSAIQPFSVTAHPARRVVGVLEPIPAN